MRNRPDSRSRLTGLHPVGQALPRRAAGLPVGQDDRWPSTVRRAAEPAVGGGWVPDVDRPEGDDDPQDPGELDEDPQDDAPPRDPLPPPVGGAARVRYSPQHAWGRVAQRWVPEPLREARVDPGRRGALLLTVVAAVAALVAAVGVWRDQPASSPVQAVSLTQVSSAPLGTGARAPATGMPTSSRQPSGSRATVVAGPARSSTDGAVLVVSVTGAVRHPGLVQLMAGSRVADAIAKAGGTTAGADLTGLNLAARLTDGTSVVVSDQAGGGSAVSGPDAGSVPAASGRPAGKVDLNTADAATLDALPGVGPVTAAAIVTWREKNGRFTSVEQLQEIPGIGPAKYAALAPLLMV